MRDAIHQLWSIDFVSDAHFDGSCFRDLTIADNCNLECMTIVVAISVRCVDVVDALESIRLTKGLVQERSQTDYGSVFISKDMDRWAYDHGLMMDYSRPGNPTDNLFVESFNVTFRDEYLNTHWFLPLEEAVEKIGQWRYKYNHYRTQSS